MSRSVRSSPLVSRFTFIIHIRTQLSVGHPFSQRPAPCPVAEPGGRTTRHDLIPLPLLSPPQLLAAMDQLSLLNLLSNSTKRLASLHEELGHPPDRLEDAIQSLHNVLHAAVQGQLDQVQGEVDDARAQLANGERRVRRLKVVLGEEPSGSSGSQTTATSSASSSSMTRSASTRKASGSASAETKEVSTARTA